MYTRKSTLRDIDNLSEDVLSYLSNTKRSVIIKMLEDIKRDFNSYTNNIKSLRNDYYSGRLNEISKIIYQLKKINANWNENHPIRFNQAWLSWIVKFFANTEYAEKQNEWYDSTSPSVKCMTLILSRLGRYNAKDPLHVGRELESLGDAFLEKAAREDKAYDKAIIAYKQKQLELKSIKCTNPLVPLPEVKKSYQPEEPPKKLNFEKPELKKIKNRIGLVLANKPKVPTVAEETTAKLFKELAFTQCENLDFLNKDSVRFKRLKAFDAIKTPKDFFAELQESKKYQEQKNLSDELTVPIPR